MIQPQQTAHSICATVWPCNTFIFLYFFAIDRLNERKKNHTSISAIHVLHSKWIIIIIIMHFEVNQSNASSSDFLYGTCHSYNSFIHLLHFHPLPYAMRNKLRHPKPNTDDSQTRKFPNNSQSEAKFPAYFKHWIISISLMIHSLVSVSVGIARTSSSNSLVSNWWLKMVNSSDPLFTFTASFRRRQNELLCVAYSLAVIIWPLAPHGNFIQIYIRFVVFSWRVPVVQYTYTLSAQSISIFVQTHRCLWWSASLWENLKEWLCPVRAQRVHHPA